MCVVFNLIWQGNRTRIECADDGEVQSNIEGKQSNFSRQITHEYDKARGRIGRLNCIYFNANSLTSNVDEFIGLICICEYDIVIIIET